MLVRAGTSGFSYDAWRGSFYPATQKPSGMLAYYGTRLPTVEINNTFYRLPKASVVAGWASVVPETFRFVLKAPRRITHSQRLSADTFDALRVLLEVSAELGDKRGPLLFQLPPNFRQDLSRLRDFLAQLPAGVQAAFEFRHPSWLTDDTYAALAERGAALCLADVDEEGASGKNTPFQRTAPFTYLRLRRPNYGDDDLRGWLDRCDAAGFAEVYVFFKHEDEGTGPALATRLQQLAATHTQ